ncbi:MAG: hypothetical protein JWL93_1198 [Hyphomicrobiales bacterium]|nr:hypothetical protein [Hyphomicrobiales bacterium]
MRAYRLILTNALGVATYEEQILAPHHAEAILMAKDACDLVPLTVNWFAARLLDETGDEVWWRSAQSTTETEPVVKAI